MSKRIDWKLLEPGIYARGYGNDRAYKLQGRYDGRQVYDVLGIMPIEDVRVIRETLRRNRVQGTPPYSYAEMQAAETTKVQENSIRARQAQQALLEAEKKRLHSTVEQVWEGIYWPERLTNVHYAEKDTRSIDARWRNILKPFFGKIPMSELRKEHFVEFIQQMRQTTIPSKLKPYEEKKRNKNKKPVHRLYSESSIHKLLANMRRLWAVGLEHGLVAGAFPGKAFFKQVKEAEHKICYLELEEVRLLLDTIYERRMLDKSHHDVFCYVILSLFLGLRAGEIHKLTPQAVARCIIEETKNGRSRFIDFNLEPIRLMFEERLRLYPVESEQSLIFTTTEGNAFQRAPERYKKIIQELCFNDVIKRKNNKREFINFHSLRHTYATHQMISGGVTRENLQKLLGHQKPEMTMRYVEIADHVQARESRKILNVYNLGEGQKQIQ